MPALSTLLRPRKTARHAKPSRTAPLLVAGGMATALAVVDASVAATSASAGGSVAQFERLAQCESGGNWSINTGNGYYGGLQFNLATWRGLGLGGYPHQASRSQQIAAGQKLHSQRGWQPWPACTRKLGLSGDGGYSGTGGPAPAPPKPVAAPERAVAKPAAAAPVQAAAAPAAAPARVVHRASRSMRTVVAVRRATPAPAFDGHVMTVADARAYRASVKTWQQRMRARGWRITADGHFGPRSSAVARSFARNYGIPATPGTVNAAVWNAAWTLPVT